MVRGDNNIPKDKCGWCGLNFDFLIYKPAYLIEDTDEYLCDDCYEKFKGKVIDDG